MKNLSREIENPHIMKEFPEEFLRFVAKNPNQPNLGPWKINLDPYISSTFLGIKS